MGKVVFLGVALLIVISSCSASRDGDQDNKVSKETVVRLCKDKAVLIGGHLVLGKEFDKCARDYGYERN